MSDLPDRADVRASDKDRDGVAESLREAAGDGRLTLAELEERLDLTYKARTYGELAPITSDLPAPASTGAAPAPVPADAREIDRDVSALLASNKLSGRFVCPPTLHARAVLGEVKIDFTDAIVPRGEVVIQADSVLGSVELTFPEGVDVRMDGPTVLGERKNKLPPPSSPDAPVIRVRGTVVLGQLTAQPRKWNRLRKLLEGS